MPDTKEQRSGRLEAALVNARSLGSARQPAAEGDEL